MVLIKGMYGSRLQRLELRQLFGICLNHRNVTELEVLFQPSQLSSNSLEG